MLRNMIKIDIWSYQNTDVYGGQPFACAFTENFLYERRNLMRKIQRKVTLLVRLH